MIKIYRDEEASAIFIENANGAQFLNSLQAVVASSGLVSILDLARGIEVVSDTAHTQFVQENGTVYSGTAIDVCNTLNSVFQTSGSPQGISPTITSSLAINLVEGETINYELTADFGVGYEWDLSNVSGVTTVEGNARKLIGGSSLLAGTYNIPVKAINYNGEDSKTIVVTVSTPPFANTKSVQFNNNDYLGANAALLDSALGRATNGGGSGDAWTVSCYFKPGTSSNASQTIFYFGANDVANNGQLQIKYNGSLNRVEFRYGSNNNRLNLVTSSNSLTVSQWSHIMVTYDGGSTGSSSASLSSYYGRFSIYIDGVLQSTTNSHSNYGYTGSISGQNLRTGRWNSGQNLRNSCKVDELAVWDSDQSANISSIYNSGTPFDLTTLTPSPSHWWRMGDSDNYPTIQDKIGTAHFSMYNMTVADIVSDVP